MPTIYLITPFPHKKIMSCTSCCTGVIANHPREYNQNTSVPYTWSHMSMRIAILIPMTTRDILPLNNYIIQMI